MTSTAPAPRQYAFIVGCARTGSTLLRHVLNRSEGVAIAPETHFVRRATELRLSARLGAARGEEDLARIVDDLYRVDARSGTGYWAWLRRTVPRDEVLRRLVAAQPTVRDLFSLLIDLWVEREAPGATVIGEKSPEHVTSVPTFATWFPGARFIHTFRDPRGIYASELRRRREGRWGPKRSHRSIPGGVMDLALPGLEAVRTTLVWRRADDLDRAYRELLGERYRLVRFEDLVRDPEAQVRDVCATLGVAFDDRMLAVDVVGSSFAAPRHGSAGFDPSTATRWRRTVGPLARLWLGTALGRRLRRRGYAADGRAQEATSEKLST